MQSFFNNILCNANLVNVILNAAVAWISPRGALGLGRNDIMCKGLEKSLVQIQHYSLEDKVAYLLTVFLGLQ